MLVTACGIAVADIISIDLPRIANPGEVVFGPEGNKMHIGGHPCNISVDLVQLGLHGREISTIISIGNDAFGEYLAKGLEKFGVRTHILKSPIQTSSNLILVVKGEDRRFHVDVGANQDLDPNYVVDQLRRDKPLVFYIGATGWLGKFDEKLDFVCENAKKMNCITLASIIAPFGKGWDYIIPSLKYLDIFHCNTIEASRITKIDDPVEASKTISKQGVRVCLISAGERGLYARLEGTTLKMPAFRVKSVDPTGAGDAFCAGIIHRLTSQPYRSSLGTKRELKKIELDDWKQILMYASACGAACCTAPGTTTAVKPRIIQKILREKHDYFTGNIEIL